MRTQFESFKTPDMAPFLLRSTNQKNGKDRLCLPADMTSGHLEIEVGYAELIDICKLFTNDTH